MRALLLAILFVSIDVSADSYSLEIKNPQEAIEAIALEGAANICEISERLSLEQKFEMTEIARYYESRRRQMGISYNISLANQAANEKFGITRNPTYEMCARAFHK